MDASYNPHQPQGEVTHQPIIGLYFYPLHDQGASVHCPPPPVQDCLPQGNPPETDLPPAYSALEQEPPPAYDSEAVQLTYHFQPQIAYTTVMVTTQAMTATTTALSPPEDNHMRIAICALVFSLCTLITCGAFVISLPLSIPALILSIAALKNRGGPWRRIAKFCICLNVTTVVITVLLLCGVVTPLTVTSRTLT